MRSSTAVFIRKKHKERNRGSLKPRKRVLGVDSGEQRTGIAVSDPLGMIANGIGVIRSGYDVRIAEEIVRYAVEYDCERIILGCPVNMNGTIGPRAEKVSRLAELIRERTSIPVETFDERLTTTAAHRFLNETNVRGGKRKAVIDSLSAQIILQNWMDANRESERRQST